MAACRPVVFNNVKREHFLAVRARIRAQADVQVLGDTGTAAGNGITAKWEYDEPSQTLTIQCLTKPFWISEGIVAAGIRDLVMGL